MKRILMLFLIFIILTPTISLFGCTETKSQTSTVLRVCNCEDYIDESLLEAFTEETGIEVVYSTYGTNENLYNELVINPNSYDLVVPSEYMIEKLAVEGRIQPLTRNVQYQSYLTDYNANISPFIKGRLEGLNINEGKYANQNLSLYDFMVGYKWGTMGWVYNIDNVSIDDVKNWCSPFKNSDLNGKITIKDAVRDSYIVGLAMVYEDELYATNDNDVITQILNRTDKDSIDKVGEKLSSLKSKLYGFEVDSGKNDIVLGRIDAYVAWSGDAAYAIDVAAGEVEDEDGSILEGDAIRNLSYYIPDEGSNIWFDGFVMPSGSTNYEAVYKFLEFISRPSSVYANMYYTGYTSMIANGEEFEVEEYDEYGNVIGTYQTTLFDEVVVGWFDESDDLAPNEGIEVDLSYFFGGSDKTVVVSEESYGRLIAQYPTEEIVNRCAVMSYFDTEALMDINEMWEKVKGETLPWWVIILMIVLVLFIATLIILYRNKDKIKWFKLPERKTSYAERKGLTEISRKEIK